jgi:hypothetical protein
MEGKDRWEQNGRIFLLSLHLFHYPIYLISRLHLCLRHIVCIRPTHHPGTPTVGNLVLPYYSIVSLYSTLNLPCIMIGYINIE